LDNKVSVWITQQQFERLEDFKTEIRRKYDHPFSKQQAFLCAIEVVRSCALAEVRICG
jgi:hypothetical protein